MKQKRNPIIQVVVPAKEYQVLQDMADRTHTSVSAVSRKLLLDSPEYKLFKKSDECNEK